MKYLKAIGVLVALAAVVGFIVLICDVIPHMISDKWGWIFPVALIVILEIYLIAQLFDNDQANTN